MGADITREDGCFRVITAEDPRAWPKSPVNIPSDGRRHIAREG